MEPIDRKGTASHACNPNPNPKGTPPMFIYNTHGYRLPCLLGFLSFGLGDCFRTGEFEFCCLYGYQVPFAFCNGEVELSFGHGALCLLGLSELFLCDTCSPTVSLSKSQRIRRRQSEAEAEEPEPEDQEAQGK